VEVQSHGQLQSNNETSFSKLELKTTKDLERHVSEIYAYANFYKFQEEFWVCEVDDKKVTEYRHVLSTVNDSQNTGVKRHIVYNPSNHVAHCSCKMFDVSHAVIYCVF